MTQIVKDKAKILAAGTLAKLGNDLVVDPVQIGLSAEEISAVIHRIIENSFAQCVNHEERTAYYKELARLIHPDKFEAAHPELYNYLVTLNLKDEPFNKIEAMYQNFVQAEEDKKFWRNAFRDPKIFGEQLFNNPLIKNLNHYVFPLNLMVRALYGSVVLALAIAVIAFGILSGLATVAIKIVNALVDSISNFITNDRYEQKVDEYKEGEFANYKSAYIIAVKEIMMRKAKEAGNDEEASGMYAMNDDIFWKYLIARDVKNGLFSQEAIEKNHNKKIKRTIPVSSTDRIKFSFQAFAEAITFPLSEVEGGMAKFGSVLARSLRVITAPFVFAAIILPEIVTLSLNAVVKLADIGILVVNYSALAILNLPLDLYNFLVDLTNMLFKRNVKNNEFPKSPTMAPLLLEGGQNKEPTSSLEEDIAPTHFTSPFKTASVVPQKDDEAIIESQDGIEFKCDM